MIKDYIYECMKTEYNKMEDMCAEIGAYSELQVFHQVGNMLHWMMDYYDRKDKVLVLKESEKQLFLGIKFVNNCLKHNISFITYQERESGYTTFPMKLDGKGCFYCYVWKDMNYLPSNSYHHKDQFDAYMKECCGRPLILIVRSCMEIIKKIEQNS